MIFKKLHDFHDHRYVLTTKKNLDRQECLKKELKDWDLELFFGVDKSEVSIEQYKKDGIYDEEKAIEIDRSGRKMTLGAVCCSLGHRYIYEHFLESDHERIIVFEDDVLVNSETESILDAALDEIPEDAELIYWGWLGVGSRPRIATLKLPLYHLQHSLGLLSYNHTMIDNLYPRPFNEHFSIAGKHFCIHAYTLTRSGAEKLVRWQTPVILNADNAIMYAILNGDLKAYISHTQFFSQSSLDKSSGIPSLTQS
ncbi:MAG: glycosyltransferase family 25 protein [Pyrinomonadaceae bacterium]